MEKQLEISDRFISWINEIEKSIEGEKLSFDYRNEGYKIGKYSVIINSEIGTKLKAVCKDNKFLMYSFLVASMKINLSKYMCKKCITVGIPFYNINNSRKIVYSKVLPLTSNINYEDTYKRYLFDIKRKITEVYENQEDLNKDVLVESGVCKDIMELTPISICMRDFHEDKYINYITSSNKNDISFLLELMDDKSIKLDVLYNMNKFSEGTINNISRTFEKVLDMGLNDYDKKISNIEILEEKEKNKILYDFNNTTIEYEKNKTIHELFEEQVDKTPDNIAVAFEGENLTYRELNKRANALARELRAKGVEPNSIVGIMANQSIEMIIGIIGILKSGGTYLPIDATYPTERIEYMLADSKVTILLSTGDLIGKISFNGEVIDLFNDMLFVDGDLESLEKINNSRDLAYIIYTSGTTGKPKGVMVKHCSLVNYCHCIVKKVSLTSRDETALLSSYAFDLGYTTLFTALITGIKLNIVSEENYKNPEKLIELLKTDITYVKITPSLFNIIVNSQYDKTIFKDSKLRFIILGGEPINIKDVEKFMMMNDTKNISIMNHYGPTESTIGCIATIINPENISEFSNVIGKPLNNIKAYILDKCNNILPIGVQGELCISGEGLARGYLNRTDLTSEKFVDSPFELGTKMYKTGDLARWLPNGNIEFLGRIDNQVKIRGFRIELGEIESGILQHEYVKEAAVIVTDGKDNDKHICSYIVSDKELNQLNLRDYLKESLPEYMVPSYFVKLDKMPITSNGKLDRRTLPKPNLDERLTNYEAPRNSVEEILVKIWSEVLGVDKIGINDNFFQIGGHSLKAMTLISKIHKETNKEVPLKELFKSPTIKGLSEFIENAEENIYSNIEKIEEKDYYEASSAQKRMYIMQGFDKENIAYNMPQIFELQGSIDKTKIEATFKKLVERHEALKTYFGIVEGEIVQKIDGDYEFSLKERVETKSIEKVFNNFIKPFDLAKAPLFRAEIVKTEDRKYLLIDMHHIISDGVSMSILINEFAALYNVGYLEQLKLQYKDFAAWQNNFLKSEEMKKQEEYWINMFNDEIPVLNMPTDYERPAIQSFEGDSVSFEVEKNISHGLKELTKKTGTTMHMVLLSAFNILLSKYSGQEDIVIGTPIAGRPHSDLQNIMGMFVNTLALRNKPEGAKKYIDFLNEVKENSLKAYDYQSYQLETLIEKLDIARDTSRNPLFDIMFNMVDTASYLNIKLNDMSLIPYGSENNVAKFDLTLNAMKENDEINISIGYCSKLFNKSSIERLGKHYLAVLESIIANNEIKLGEIELLSDGEKNVLLNEFNDTKLDYQKNKTIQELFEAQVKKTPDNIAVIFQEKKLTYRELNEKSNSLARVLRNKGVKADSIIGIMVDRSLEMVIGIIGILKAGGAYLPIDSSYPKQRIEYMLSDSQSEVFLTAERLINDIEFNGEIIDLFRGEFLDYSSESSETINNEDDMAYVIYTSGTTGNPKGAMIKHSNLNNFIMSFNRNFNSPIGFKDKVLSLTNYVFDVSLCEIFIALISGATLVINDKHKTFDPLEISKLIVENEITFTYIPPLLLTNVYEELKKFKGEVKLNKLLVGVEAIRGKTLNKFYELNKDIEIINGYGPTETTICSTFYKVNGNEVEDKVVPIGRPIENTKIYILNNNKLQPIGVPGELCISGDGLAGGYLNKTELTAEKFVDNPFEPGTKMYKTGDLARWLSDGNIEFLGRIDNQVKIRGFRIELGEIENAILKCSGVKQTVVVVRERQTGEKYLVAFVKGDEIKEINIRKELRNILPNYMSPDFIVEVNEMPITTRGKLDRRALQQLEKLSIKREEYVQVKTEIEKIVAAIWKELLNLDSISSNDSFFEIGGNSLLVVNMVDKIQKQIKISLEISDIYKYPILEELAAIIDRKKLSLEEIKEGVILLRKGNNKMSKKLIFVHGGSGSIGGYANLFREDKFGITENCDAYAIKFNKLKNCTPTEISINELANEYVSIIEKYFKDEIIILGGWCIGGLIITEMAKILERKKINVEKLLIFNAIAPKKWKEKVSFNIESEVEYLKGIVNFDFLEKIASKTKNIEELWEIVLPTIIESTDILDKIPKELLASIPNYKMLKIRDVIYYLNCMRTLHNARVVYIPKESIKTKVYYFNPIRDITINNKEKNIKIWQKYCKNKIEVLNIYGDEHTIFDEDIKDTINKINQAILES